MTFRISLECHENKTLLRIDGDLCCDGLAEFNQIYKGSRAPLTIDLSGTKHLDQPALEMLRSLHRKGVNLIGVSPYLALRLNVEERKKS
jgi:hypothetical protein